MNSFGEKSMKILSACQNSEVCTLDLSAKKKIPLTSIVRSASMIINSDSHENSLLASDPNLPLAVFYGTQPRAESLEIFSGSSVDSSLPNHGKMLEERGHKS